MSLHIIRLIVVILVGGAFLFTYFGYKMFHHLPGLRSYCVFFWCYHPRNLDSLEQRYEVGSGGTALMPSLTDLLAAITADCPSTQSIDMSDVRHGAMTWWVDVSRLDIRGHAGAISRMRADVAT
jgi:hypothetical protein